jgi:hypothetical protein
MEPRDVNPGANVTGHNEQSAEDKVENESPETSAFDYTIDVADVCEYVETVDPEAQTFTVVVVAESEIAKRRAEAMGEKGVCQFDVRADSLPSQLQGYVNAGYACFLTVNETDGSGRRAQDSMVRPRALFADIDARDGQSMQTTWALEPSLIVETSAGSFHVYWLIQGAMGWDTWDRLERNLVDHYRSDPAVKDRSRVLRIPGTVHQKGKPFRVQIVQSTGKRYTQLELEKAFGPLQAAPNNGTDSSKYRTHRSSDETEGNLRIIEECLSKIKPDRLADHGDHNYDPWLQIGMVAYHCTDGDVRALDIWDRWSRQGKKYRPGECHEKWPTFETSRERKLGIGSLTKLVRRTIGDPKWCPSKPQADAAEKTDSWAPPQPLVSKIEPEPYPLDALPDGLRQAVEEVADYSQAPPPLVACCALSALSLTGQPLINIRRNQQLCGPVSLNFMTIADSGERKTSVDDLFMKPIREWQAKRAEEMKPEIERYKAEHSAWTAEREGILAALREAAKKEKGRRSDDLKEQLFQLQKSEPRRPRVPWLFLADETPENLAWRLYSQWPSAGLISSEAGIVLGGHSMGAEKVLGYLTLLNVLWDGGEHSVGRKTSESFTVRDVRLTCGLQLQEPALLEFIKRTGQLARGIGFFARFLISRPLSTQGTRLYREPQAMPHLYAFRTRIGGLLDLPVPIQDDGRLKPATAYLGKEARQAWITFHDEVERELRNGGELREIRDVASKAAENAARLAALFQACETDPTDGLEVSADNFVRASRIVAWHLSESRRFLGELVLPDDLRDAAKLDAWLIDHCRREPCSSIRKNHVRQCGPGPLRDGKRLDAALKVLTDLDRVRQTHAGKQLLIEVNRALIGEWQT